MNAYEIIKNGLENKSDESSIIDELQLEYPTSQIENNIFLIEETKTILESPTKSLPAEIKSNRFLVKYGKNFIDIDNGRIFNVYKEKTYSHCIHGLCKKLNTLVLKNIIKKSHTPSVFVAITEEPKENKTIKIKYQNDNKKQQIWEFSSYEIDEAIKGIDEGLKNRQMAIKLCCPRECIQNLIKHIDINQKMERSRNGNNKGKRNSSVGKRETSRKARRKN